MKKFTFDFLDLNDMEYLEFALSQSRDSLYLIKGGKVWQEKEPSALRVAHT